MAVVEVESADGTLGFLRAIRAFAAVPDGPAPAGAPVTFRYRRMTGVIGAVKLSQNDQSRAQSYQT